MEKRSDYGLAMPTIEMARHPDNRKLRVGVIGGGFGRTHLTAFQVCENVEVEAFCRRTRQSAENTAKEFQIPRVFTDYRELLELKGLDAVSIAAPVYLHYPIAMEAMDRGIHVLCEKPLALNKDEAAAMLLKAEEKKLAHMTAFNYRFVPAIRRMKELLEEGYVGNRIYHVDGVWFGETRADLNAPLGWRYRREMAGFGALGDMGVHLIDLVRWLAGDFKKVCAHTAIFNRERKLPDGSGKGSVTVEDSCAFVAEMEGGAQASIHVSGAARSSNYRGLDIFGSDGMLRLLIDRKAPGGVPGRLWGAQGSGAVPQPIPIPERLTQGSERSAPERAPAEFIFATLTRRFAEWIRTGEAAVPSFREGFEAQKVLDALLKSAAEECWVRVA
ncbi:MAG: hypothetical protein A2W10_08655 [Deltaproteobacteria bacterium RBG_16_55_12]|nr:MAG: hypothetical protein A2W10_08655 [Deltaproteobacteria bacterium RBG_16_55_12]